MNISYSSENEMPLIECIDKIHEIYRVRWNFKKIPDTTSSYSFYEEDFDHEPTEEEIKNVILKYHNNNIANTIINDFYWNNTKFYLTLENQNYYKFLYDMLQDNPSRISDVLIKGEINSTDTYVIFNSVDEYKNFYFSMIDHIQNSLKAGWQIKNNLSWSEYSDSLSNLSFTL